MHLRHVLWLILLLTGSAVLFCGCQSELDRRDPAKKYSRIPQNAPASWQNSTYSR